MDKNFYQKLLDFYWELFHRGVIDEEEVVKKYGNEITEYLKVEGRGMTKLNYRRKDAKFEGLFDLSQKIHEVENKISNLQREEFEKQQITTNKVIAIAIITQALLLFIQVYLGQQTLRFDNSNVILFIQVALFALVVVFLFKLSKYAFSNHK